MTIRERPAPRGATPARRGARTRAATVDGRALLARIAALSAIAIILIERLP